MNKATFKALREHAGISYAALADALEMVGYDIEYHYPADDGWTEASPSRERR